MNTTYATYATVKTSCDLEINHELMPNGDFYMDNYKIKSAYFIREKTREIKLTPKRIKMLNSFIEFEAEKNDVSYYEEV